MFLSTGEENVCTCGAGAGCAYRQGFSPLTRKACLPAYQCVNPHTLLSLARVLNLAVWLSLTDTYTFGSFDFRLRRFRLAWLFLATNFAFGSTHSNARAQLCLTRQGKNTGYNRHNAPGCLRVIRPKIKTCCIALCAHPKIWKSTVGILKKFFFFNRFLEIKICILFV